MSDYTPTMLEIRAVWCAFSEYGGLADRPGPTLWDDRLAEFNRAIAAHDGKVRAEMIGNLPRWPFTKRRREAQIAWDRWRDASLFQTSEEMTVGFEAGFTLGIRAYRSDIQSPAAIRAVPATDRFEGVEHIHDPDGQWWAGCRRCSYDRQDGLKPIRAVPANTNTELSDSGEQR